MTNETTVQARKAVNNTAQVWLYAQASGLHMTISKAMARQIIRQCEKSAGFKFENSGVSVTLYV